MKKIILAMLVLGIMVMPIGVMAEDLIGEANALLKPMVLDSSKKALEVALKAVQQDPKSYDANWGTAKAYRLVGEQSKKAGLPNWKSLCKENGKKGMEYAEKAIAMEPNKVDGHFWYACNVGTYSDGVSILTALREGLKDKTQKGFETAYKLDKLYFDAGPILGIGRFWSVLPWPLNDKKKALMYLEEFQKYFPNKPEGQVYLGQAYLDLSDKTKAKVVLEKAATCNDKYFSDMAKKMLNNM
jgi:tetratricopeptide (TPR) repeat protein